MSISIYGGKQNGTFVDTVYPMSVLQDRIYADINDICDEGTPNPHYDPVLDFNLSSRNAIIVLSALNIKLIDGYFSMNAKEFQGLCVAWLRANVGKPRVSGFGGSVDMRVNGPIIFDAGVPEGYVNRQIQRMSALASAVIEMGAEIIYGT